MANEIPTGTALRSAIPVGKRMGGYSLFLQRKALLRKLDTMRDILVYFKRWGGSKL